MLELDASKFLNFLINAENITSNMKIVLQEINDSIAMPEFQQHIEQQQNPKGSTWLPPKVDPTRKALIKTGNYKKGFRSSINDNSIGFYHEYFWAKTHEKALKVNIFGRGVLYQFPERSAIWLSKKAIHDDIPNIIIKKLKNV